MTAADEAKFVCDCFLCKQSFQFGPHVYDGRRILEWDVMVCRTCYSGNWDGIVPETYPHLIPYLQARGVEVTLNAKGWIDWPKLTRSSG
jgi:hypothetical protein